RGAELNGPDGGIHIVEGSNHDHRRFVVSALQLPQQVEAVSIRKAYVENDGVRLETVDLFQTLGHAGCTSHLIAFLREEHAERLKDHLLIVYDENTSLLHEVSSFARGRVRRRIVPAGSLGDTSTRPPWA